MEVSHKIKGQLQMPESMFKIVETISQVEKENSQGYLINFKRLVDPVMIGTLFGLYNSKELPPLNVEEYPLAKTWEFNVEITSFADILNHLLFCLWVKKKGSPEKFPDKLKYREELYAFISKLLDDDYYRCVLIPFYLKKADEGEERGTSFLYRLWNSDKIGVEKNNYSPEYLALEFNLVQNEFISSIVDPLEKNEIISGKTSLTSNTEILKNFENNFRLFIQRTLENEIGKDWWKQAVPQDVQNTCSDLKEKRERLTGPSEESYPMIYYADFNDYYKIIEKRDNWSKVFRKYFPDLAWIKTKLLTELSPIRNDIAHSRELTPDIAQKLRSITDEILKRIKGLQTT